MSRSAILAPGVGPVFYAGRGSEGRTPALSQTDISVQYMLGLGGRRRLTVGLNVLNLFNQAQGVSRYSLETDQGVQVSSTKRTTTQDGPMWAPQSTSSICRAIRGSCNTSSSSSRSGRG